MKLIKKGLNSKEFYEYDQAIRDELMKVKGVKYTRNREQMDEYVPFYDVYRRVILGLHPRKKEPIVEHILFYDDKKVGGYDIYEWED